MPVHHARSYDGHVIFIEARRAPDGSYYSSFSIHPIRRQSPAVYQTAPSDDLTFDSTEHAIKSAFDAARAWIDDGHRS